MFFQNQSALILEKFLPSVYSRNYFKKTEKEEGEGRFNFNFVLTLREAAIFILLTYLWDIRKKPVVEHFF